MERRVSVLMHGSTPPKELGPLCQFAEKLGFDELWVSEDYFMLAAPASAAIALQHTKDISVGIGIMSAVVRHPAVTAMEISTLAAAFPHRLHVGIGHGVPAWMRQMGLSPKSQLASLRDAVNGIRRLLEGETLEETGNFEFHDIKLEHPVPNVPLYTGVTGPKSLALSGEIADGTILSALSGPRYVEWASKIVAHSAEAAQRTGTHLLPTFVIYCVDRDRNKARAEARSAASFYLAAMGPTSMTDAYGISDSLKAMIDKGGHEMVASEMPDEWLDWLTVSGDPDECAARIRDLHAAGATSVVLAPVGGDSTQEQLEITAESVLPLAQD